MSHKLVHIVIHIRKRQPLTWLFFLFIISHFTFVLFISSYFLAFLFILCAVHISQLMFNSKFNINHKFMNGKKNCLANSNVRFCLPFKIQIVLYMTGPECSFLFFCSTNFFLCYCSPFFDGSWILERALCRQFKTIIIFNSMNISGRKPSETSYYFEDECFFSSFFICICTRFPSPLSIQWTRQIVQTNANFIIQ